ncbi:MAG: CDP-diacylglycerol--glycerol-3-phosphate 3-phosphatidyltransferase [Pseudomonadales bacterium]|nr:CDP-diacylglycerol--glycerol-3-phosphate 3-phosphatidyltransferase [Pseudomonadales bacterium]
MNIPNILTSFRILLIPLFVVLFYLPYKWSYLASAACFALAAITDWFDGYLARKLDQTTPFGAFLDPVADKLMVAVVLVLMTERFGTAEFAIPAAVIVGREIVISALREWMAELGERASIAVSYIGKVKTTLQMIAILVLLAVIPDHGHWMMKVGYGLLYLAVILTLWSAFLYLRAAWPLLTRNMGADEDNNGKSG